MDIIKELMGKSYPIKNENNEVISYKLITNVRSIDNIPGVFITIDNNDSGGIVINYNTALDIIKGKE